MARIPTPRSLSQIIGSMADIFKSRFGARGVKPGSPILGFIEAAAQSDARNAQDIFGLLEANDLNRATGAALDEHGKSVGLRRRGETVARGKVTIRDTSFTKRVGKVWHGAPAPIAGSSFIYVTGAADFDATGEIYIARNLSTYEGPIPYTKTLHTDGVWKLTLSSNTQRYHAVGEAVTLAQGGNRQVPAGTVVSTPESAVGGVVSYSTVRAVTLLDGENELADVEVRCQRSGPSGNVPAGALTVASEAFTGMAVENPNAISNGLPAEDDAAYRARIRKFKQSRSRGATAGTNASIESAAYGVTATDEASAVLSSRLVERRTAPTTLYIDDGGGYEERTAGVALEVLVDDALGGEDRFQLALGRPVAKAFVKTSLAAPFSLVAGDALSVLVGGSLSVHAFDAASFDDIRAASAYEVVASINSNPELLFSARTADNGTRVSIFAKGETNDDLQVVDGGANLSLGFSSRRVETLRLYKNDRPLYKDGLKARIRTAPQSEWGSLDEGETLVVNVDGTGERTYVIRGVDFAALGYPYAQVSETNSLESWAAVINAKVAGVTATIAGPGLELTSNLGTNERASIAISAESTLAVAGMFNGTLIAAGRSNDFFLDRNLGQVELASPLLKGDRLTAGTAYTRAYIDSDELSAVDFGANTAKWWFVVDGETEIIRTGLTSSDQLTFTFSNVVKKVSSTSPLFVSLKPGDWMVWWDANMDANATINDMQSMVRVSNVDPLGYWFEVDDAAESTGTATVTVSPNSVAFVRTTGLIQKVEATGAYTPTTFASYLSSKLVGASAIVYETNWVRLLTNTFENGSLTLVTQNTYAASIGFDVGVVENEPPHMAVVESGNAEGDVPAFYFDHVSSADASGNIGLVRGEVESIWGLSNMWMGKWLRPLPTATFLNRYDSMTGDTVALGKGTGVYKARRYLTYPARTFSTWNGSRLSLATTFGLTAYDTLNVALDNSEFSLDTFRRCKSETSSTYGINSIRLTDIDTNTSLYSVFGAAFDFSDFALHMRPRCKVGVSPTNVLWRLQQFGPAKARMGYSLPSLPEQAATITATTGDYYDVSAVLKSGPEKLTLTGTTRIKYVSQNVGNGAALWLRTAFDVTTLVRAGTTVTATLDADHGLSVGDTVYVTSTDVRFPAGPKTVSALNGSNAFSYTEAGDAVASHTPTGMIVGFHATNDQWTNVAQGDAMVLGSAFDATVRGTWIVTVKQTSYRLYVRTPQGAPNSTALVAEGDIHCFSTSTTTTELLSAAATSNIARGTLLGAGGPITKGTYNEWLDGTAGFTQWTDLVDGINYIDSQTVSSSNFQFTLKNAVSASLGTPNDYANEEVRLVPTTAKNLVDFLGATSVTALGAAGASIKPSVRAGRVQIASGTLGSNGKVHVTGGSANSVGATMTSGTPELSSTGSMLTVERQDALGLLGGAVVAIQNSVREPKVMPLNDITVLSEATRKLSMTGSRTWAGNMNGPVSGGKWYVEKHGRFASWTLATPGDAPNQDFFATEGDWVYIPEFGGSWGTVSTAANEGRMSVKLNDGRVLLCGGYAGGSTLDTAYIYNPTSGAFTATGNMGAARLYHTATLLSNGKVLVTGGTTTLGVPVTSAEVYDPAAGTWSNVPNPMSTARAQHTATRMSDGKVVLLGGFTTGGTPLATYEVFDPSNNTFTAGIEQLVTKHCRHTATLLTTDVIMVAGGWDGTNRTLITEFFNYATNAVVQGPNLTEPKEYHTATKLADGRVVFAGGLTTGGLASAKTCAYDPTGDSMAALSDMTRTRNRHGAALLSDGKVLVGGGYSGGSLTAEIYDPILGMWTATVSPQYGIWDGEFVTLDDGRVLSGSGAGVVLFSENSGLSKQNAGVFQVAGTAWDVANGHYAFWVENPHAVEEYVGLAQAQFFKYDSIMPGDTIYAGSKEFTVTAIDEASVNAFYVREATGAATIPASPLTTVMPAAPARFIKRAQYVAQHPTFTDKFTVLLAGQEHTAHMSSNYGTTVIPLNKLEFPTASVAGSDAYIRNTGLIASVNQIIYGDEGDRDAYPGIVSTGSVVNVSGPIVKRVKMAFDIRARSGVSKASIQNAAATEVNSAPVGAPVAISSVIDAIHDIPGVEAVTVLSPTYGQGKDKIPVQSYEKALVLNPSTDITVNFIGE